jgi:putative acetyltransferase
MKIAPERPDQIEAIGALHDLAFGGGAESRLVTQLRNSGKAVVSLVAEIDGHLAGHIVLSRLRSPARALALAPLATASHFQRRGVASALVRDALARAHNCGEGLVFVLGDPAFYERLGFSRELASRYPSRYSGKHFMSIALAEPIPEPREVVYADAFAELD